MKGPAAIGLAAALALVAPLLAGAVSDRRATPRLAATVHLWALIGAAAAPTALLVCLGTPGDPVARACAGMLEHPHQALGWVGLALASLAVGALLVAGVRVLRVTRAMGLSRWLPDRPSIVVSGVPVHIVPAGQPIAFTAGLLRPRVVVSTGLLGLLDEEERMAILAHEVAHARAGHLPALFVGRVLARGLGWLPPVRRAAASLRRELEASADEAARRVVGDPKVVATALAKVALAGPAAPLGAAPAGGDDLAYRVHRLLHGGRPTPGPEAAALAMLAALVVATVAAGCGALHAGALWAGVLGCSGLGWVGLRPLRPAPA